MTCISNLLIQVFCYNFAVLSLTKTIGSCYNQSIISIEKGEGYYGKQNYVKRNILPRSRSDRRDCNRGKGACFQKAFVCSDPDLIKFGVTKKVTDILDKNGLAYEIYSDIKANPTIQNVQHGVEAFKKAEADYLIAIGGGSSMDTSKAIGIIIANPEFEDVRSLEGVAPTKNHAYRSLQYLRPPVRQQRLRSIMLSQMWRERENSSVSIHMICLSLQSWIRI